MKWALYALPASVGLYDAHEKWHIQHKSEFDIDDLNMLLEYYTEGYMLQCPPDHALKIVNHFLSHGQGCSAA